MSRTKREGGRAPNLESTIYEGADGRWHARIWMGTKSDGSPDRRHRTGKTEAIVAAKVRKLEAERDAGKTTKAGRKPTVETHFDYFLDVVLPLRDRAPNTIAAYRSDCKNWIYPHMGKQRIDRVTAESLESLYAKMRAAGKAKSHLRKVHAIISAAYAVAVKRELVARSPTDLIDPPELGDTDMQILTREEAAKVLAAAHERRNGVRWSVGLACGLRQGEALGLRWSYVDLDAGVAQVWHQLQRQKWQHGCEDVAACTEGKHRRPCPRDCPKAKRTQGRPHKCVTKDDRVCPKDCTGHASTCPQRTGGGLLFRQVKERRKKTIPLAPELVKLLRSHKASQAAEKLAAGENWTDHDVVFAEPDGRPLDPRRDWDEWASLLAEAGVAHHRIHSARHFAATLQLEEGVALSVVQEMLGHSDIRVTRGYQHVASPLLTDAAARAGKALFGSA